MHVTILNRIAQTQQVCVKYSTVHCTDCKRRDRGTVRGRGVANVKNKIEKYFRTSDDAHCVPQKRYRWHPTIRTMNLKINEIPV